MQSCYSNPQQLQAAAAAAALSFHQHQHRLAAFPLIHHAAAMTRLEQQRQHDDVDDDIIPDDICSRAVGLPLA